MYEYRSVGVLVFAVLLLSMGAAGVAVAADAPTATTPLQVGGEITVEDDSEETDSEEPPDGPGDSFEVSDLDAPDEVAVGETVTVTATVSNPNAFETNQSVEFRVDGDVVDRQTFTIDAEADRTVSIQLDSEEVGIGSYIHGFQTTDRGELTELEIIPFAEIDFDEQETDGESVVVDSLTLSEGGFVAIYDDDGDIRGVSDYLDAGDHEEVEVDLFDEVDEESELTAVAYLDTTDDESFDTDEDDDRDRPYVDVDGEPITDTETVTVPVEEEAENADEDESDDGDADEEDADEDESNDGDADEEDADESESDTEDDVDDGESDGEETDSDDTAAAITPAVDFRNQESNGESIVVDAADLRVDGYVAIYEDEQIIGVSDYLAAGDEGDRSEIVVELFDVRSASFDRDRLTDSTTLTAVLHEETSGNEKFDHVRNEISDGPVVDEGTPVSDRAEITVPTPETASDDSDDTTESDGDTTETESGDDATDESDGADEADESDEDSTETADDDSSDEESDDEDESNADSDDADSDESDVEDTAEDE